MKSKNYAFLLPVFLFVFFNVENGHTQNIGIGTTSPSSARLQVILTDNSTVTTAILGKYTYTNNFGFGMGIRGDGFGFGTGVYGYNPGAGSAGYFNGNLSYTGIFSGPSDQRLKENVQPVGKLLNKIMQLKPLLYNFKREYNKMNLPQGQQIGFTAQDMENVFPQLVTNNYNNDLDGGKTFFYKGINYIGLIPVLTKALQELALENEGQKATIKDLQRELDDVNRRIDQLMLITKPHVRDKESPAILNMGDH